MHMYLTPHLKPPLKEKKRISPSLTEIKHTPPPATHSIPKYPPHLWRNGCHVSREIMGASEHSTRERDNLAQRLARGPVRHPGSPKMAFAALAPGSWSWVASGIAQFWNLMQERSHGALTFFVTPGARGGVPRWKFIVVVHFGEFFSFLGKDLCDVVLGSGS